MAKISIKYDDHDTLTNKYKGAMTVDRHSGTSATFLEIGQGADTMTFSGKGLAYSASDEIVAGTITAVTFRNALGDIYATFHDLKIKASALPDFNAVGSKPDFFEFLFKGNDRITGDDGNNRLFGGAGRDVMIGGDGMDLFLDGPGNDRMTGGRGPDRFTYSGGEGNDVITDFRGTGPLSQRDELSAGVAFTLRQAGRDVIVDFIDDSGTIRLLDVRLAQVRDEIAII